MGGEMTDEWEDIYTCPICKSNDCVPAGGNEKSKVLLIGEFPGTDEVRTGRPFTGATGGVLRTELAKLGIDLYGFRIANMWLHIPNHNEDCLNYSIQKVIKEAKGKQAILLIGSDTVKYFADKKVSKVNGLEITSPYLSAPIIMALVQPATVFHGCTGELQFGLKRFVKRIENDKH
jgi:uracil-DNA glycosylase family 4